MFKTLTTTFALVATTSFGGGLSEPVTFDDAHVSEPAQRTTSKFAGAYVGLSYTGTRTTTTSEVSEYDTIECPTHGRHCDVPVPDHLIGNAELNALDDSLKIGGTCSKYTSTICADGRDADGNTTHIWTDTVTTLLVDQYDVENVTDWQGLGGFAGYRWDLGAIVVGTELYSDSKLTTFETSIGVPVGDFLFYGFAGAGQFKGFDGALAGVGAEYFVFDDVSVGAKYSTGEFEDMDTETISLRVSFQF